jgi:hypothetical protein
MMKFLLAFAALALFVQLAAAGTRAHAAVPHRYLAVRLSRFRSFAYLFPIQFNLPSSSSWPFIVQDWQESMINFLNF